MANKNGILISIKAFIPVGTTLEEQLEALSVIKDAKTTGKFDAALAKGIDLEVKTESKTRRIEESPAGQTSSDGTSTGNDEGQAQSQEPPTTDKPNLDATGTEQTTAADKAAPRRDRKAA